MKKRVFAAMLALAMALCLLPGAALAAGTTITVRVTDVNTSAGIVNATVQLKQNGTATGATSTSAGNVYTISGVPAGTGYTIEVSKPRYVTGTIASFDVVDGVPVADKNIALTPGYTMDFTMNGTNWHNGVSHDFVDVPDRDTGWAWYPWGGVMSSGVSYSDRTLVLDDFHFTTSAAVALKLPAGSTVIVSGNNTFTSGQAAGGDSIGIQAGKSSGRGILTITGSGTLTGIGGDVTGGGARSYGVLTYGNIDVSSGTLTGIGGNASGDSFGVFADELGSITISDTGELTGKGGNAGNSCGVLANGGSITVSGGTLTGEGGSAVGASNGVRAGSNITVSGGAVTAKSAKAAIYASDTFGFSDHYATAANRQVAAGATAGTASPWTGADANDLNGRDKTNPYAYVRITPAALPISIMPNTAFPAGMSGGDRTVTVGHGTGLLKGEIGTLSVGGDRLTEGTDYTKANSNSVDITLKESWLNSLPAGTHRLNVPVTSGVFSSQTLYVDIVVTGTGDGGAGPDVPKTGDGSTPLLWTGLMLLAGAGLAASAVRHRKKRRGN